jgi:hypothetical protein
MPIDPEFGRLFVLFRPAHVLQPREMVVEPFLRQMPSAFVCSDRFSP